MAARPQSEPTKEPCLNAETAKSRHGPHQKTISSGKTSGGTAKRGQHLQDTYAAALKVEAMASDTAPSHLGAGRVLMG
jgi:hypothetical protein